MKVKISNYPSRLTCDIHTNYMIKKYGYAAWPDTQTQIENFLEKIEDFIQNLYTPINYFLDKRVQKINVRIDRWDTWSMDHTLAPIILPMLVQLKENTHGAPFVDNEDVPKELRATKKQIEAYGKKGEVDPKHFDRWDWVLDEMIYAFDCKANKDDVYMRIKDRVEMDKEQSRISNGFRLFGKYYENLWD
jgi:hypothetical protein